MHIFNLPPELLDEILFQSCLARRDLARALRLKLTFQRAVDHALIKTRLLDKRIYLDGWYFRKNLGFAEIFPAYLRYGIRSPPLPDDGRIADLRAACRCLAAETATDVAIVIDALSQEAAGHIGRASISDKGRRRGTKYHDNETAYEKNMQKARFSAATYLGHVHLATKSMQGGCCPTRDSHVLPSPMFLAAWAGRADPYDFSFDPHQHDSQPRVRACLSRALSTGSLEIYQYISSFHKQEARMRIDLSPWTMCEHSMFGHVDIVRHLLDLGAGRFIGERDDMCCLVHAASASQVEVVDLLLERGVDPHLIESGQGPAIQAAADVGSLVILRRLLDRSASVDEERGRELLRSAVRREHTAMVQLLLDLGVCDRKFHSNIVDMALEEGLESMADLVQRSREVGS